MAFGYIPAQLITAGAIDVVGVYDTNFFPVFPLARPIKAIIKPDSKLMEHPLETGATITDHVIFLPTEIELSLVLTGLLYRNTYQQIEQLYLNKTLLIVQTKSRVFQNQIIASIPHEEDPELFDALAVGLRMKEVQFAPPTTSTVVPRDPTNNSTVDRGGLQPQPATPDKQSAAAAGFDWLTT